MTKPMIKRKKTARPNEVALPDSEIAMLIFVNSLAQYDLINRVGFDRAKAIALACSEISMQHPLHYCHSQMFEVETLGKKSGAWVLSFMAALLCWTQMQIGGYDFMPDGKLFPSAVAALSVWRLGNAPKETTG